MSHPLVSNSDFDIVVEARLRRDSRWYEELGEGKEDTEVFGRLNQPHTLPQVRPVADAYDTPLRFDLRSTLVQEDTKKNSLVYIFIVAVIVGVAVIVSSPLLLLVLLSLLLLFFVIDSIVPDANVIVAKVIDANVINVTVIEANVIDADVIDANVVSIRLLTFSLESVVVIVMDTAL